MAPTRYQGVYSYEVRSGTKYRCVVPRSDGSWTYKRGFNSARAAHDYRIDAISKARQGEVATVPKETFEALYDLWLTRRRQYLAPGT